MSFGDDEYKAYRAQQAEGAVEFLRLVAQIATPLILLLILWRVW